MSHVLVNVAWPYANGPRHIGHVAGFGVPSDVYARYGIIHSDEALVYTLTTLDHTIHKPLSNELEPLRKGELRMIQIERT